MNTKTKERKSLILAMFFLALFILWTILIQTVDVKPLGVNQTPIGFATLNLWFHKAVGATVSFYVITDWLGLVPLGVCTVFGGMGLVQLIKRKHLRQVDFDILLLGVYYGTVMGCYWLFEQIPINYRPILINGVAEPSYPSSTTLLVLSVMVSLVFQINRRMKKSGIKKHVLALVALFCLFTVVGRVIAGVHWLTDIVGSVLLSCGLFYSYKWAVLFCCKK